MTKHDAPHAAGSPCWTDIMVNDLTRSQEFYRGLLGWEFTESDPQYGGYCNGMSDGALVSGMSPMFPGMEQYGPVWANYFATTDIQATNAAVVAAGGQTLVEPMQVGTFGWMARWLDNQGQAFGAWQAGDHTGYGVTGEPGSVSWTDLMVPDPALAKEFYGAVFGWGYEELEGGYSLCMPVGQELSTCGIGAEGPGQPMGWSVIFTVDDVDESAAKAVELGGKVTMPAYDFDYGRMVMVAGPDGEVFGLFKSADMGGDPNSGTAETSTN